MSRIFISHSSKDNAEVARLAAWLSAEHQPYFLDYDPEAGIPAGRRWEDELYYRLAGCEAVLYLCSEHSNGSKWCFAELALARALRRSIVAVQVAQAPLPSLLGDTHAIVDLNAPPQELATRLREALALAAAVGEERFAWDGGRALYPGMLAFDEADAAIFFGRDEETRELIGTLARARVSDARLVCVVGASGSGKSSVVRAGALPRLRRRTADWIVCEPALAGPALVDALAERLVRCVPAKAPAFGTARKALLALTRSPADATPLEALLRKLRLAVPGRSERSLLCTIDQGERLFAPEAADALRWLVACAAQRSLPLQLLLTLRSDHLDRMQQQLSAAAARCELVAIGPMAPQSAAQVIEGPAALARLRIEPALSVALLADADRRDGLPLLAFALHELWLRRGKTATGLTLADYRDALGGLEGSVARRAEAALAVQQPSALQWQQLRHTLTRMARLGGEGGGFVGRALPLEAVPAPVRPLLDALVDVRLLVTREHSIEIAHEVLFRAWERLRDWLDADRRFLAWQRDIDPVLRAHAEAGHDIEAVHLSGRPLAEAAPWLDSHREQLDADTIRFVEASLARARREAMRARAAQVRQLAAQGQVILAFGLPEVAARGLLLAIEAMRIASTLPQARLEADQALRQGLALLARCLNDIDAGGSVGPHAWALHPTQPLLVAGCADGRLRCWTLGKPGFEDMMRLDDGAAFEVLQFSVDGRYLAAGAGTRALLWDLQARTMGLLPVPPDAGLGNATAVAISRGSERLAIAFHHRSLVWNLSDPAQPPLLLPAGDAAIVDLDFSGDAAVLVEQPLGGIAACWRLSDGQRIGAIGDGGNQVLHSPDGRFIASSGPFSFRTSLWDVHQRENRELANNGAKVAFSPDCRHLAMASPEHFAQMWRLPEVSVAQRWRHHAETWDLDFSPDSRRLATASKNGVVHVWDSDGGAELARLIHPEGQVQPRHAGDSRHLVTRDAAGRFRLWDCGDLRHERVLHFKLAVLQAAFDPGGRLLAVGVRAGPGRIEAQLIDLQLNQAVAELETPGGEAVQGAVHARALLDAHQAASGVQARSAQGRWQITCKQPKVIEVFEGPQLRATLRHDREVRHCVFSPDETHLATVSDADHVRLWDLMHRVEVSRLTLPAPNVADAAFSPDGRLVATAGWDGTVRLWWWQPEDLLAEAARRVQRELTPEEREHHLPAELLPMR